MSITVTAFVKPSQLWPQGDARDPLGIWGARAVVVGDGSGGQIEWLFSVPAELSGAYIYTVYSLTWVQTVLVAAATSANIFVRLLTNWPDIDDDAGVQGYGAARIVGTPAAVTIFSDPFQTTQGDLLESQQRFLLLGDPRPAAGQHDLISLRMAANINLETFVAECYGYYWDRSVMNTPGGPRHPGAG